MESVTVQENIPARRVIVPAFGGPEQLTRDTVSEVPAPGAVELLVDVEAAGINYLDVYQRTGRYKLPLPYTPGFEGGRVRQVGAGVNGYAVGDRVAWINLLGSYVSQVIVPTDQALAVPDPLAAYRKTARTPRRHWA
jgi:NADPH2:quinone reductase